MKEYLFLVTYFDVMTCLTGISTKFHSDLRKINFDKVVFEDLLFTMAYRVSLTMIEGWPTTDAFAPEFKGQKYQYIVAES